MENNNKIVNGRMILFEKATIQDTLDNTFDEMEEEILQENN